MSPYHRSPPCIFSHLVYFLICTFFFSHSTFQAFLASPRISGLLQLSAEAKNSCKNTILGHCFDIFVVMSYVIRLSCELATPLALSVVVHGGGPALLRTPGLICRRLPGFSVRRSPYLCLWAEALLCWFPGSCGCTCCWDGS